MTDFQKILSSLRKREFKPIYFFDGDEPFFIDTLTDHIAKNVLGEAEKEFNQTVLYGQDTSPDDLSEIVKRYPMMSEYQVVIVKEIQSWRKLDSLKPLIEKPVPTTIMVLTMKGKKIDGRTELAKLLKKNAVYFNSARLKDNEIPSWIKHHCETHHLDIEPAAIVLLSEQIGSDLEKLNKALDRLTLMCEGKIQKSDVTKHIGISKDFNVFELQKAIGLKDVARAIYISNYFANNEKEHNIIPVTSALYRYFSKILRYHLSSNHGNQNELAREMGIPPFFIKEYRQAASNYSRAKSIEAMEILHDIDLKSKGVGNTTAKHPDLMREMVSRLIRL